MSFPKVFLPRFFTLFLCSFILTISFSPPGARSQTRDDPITIGIYKGMIGSLLYLADMQGYFKEMGVKVKVKGYQAGKFAVADLLKGKIQIAASSDFVFTLKSFAQPDLRIFTSIAEADNHFMVARSDRGIKKPVDIAGKKVGLTMGSASEYFLGDFLAANGLSFKDIQTVNLRPKTIVEQMQNGTLDVALAWADNVFKIQQALGTKVETWSVMLDQSLYFVLFSAEGWLKENKNAVGKIMKALARSAAYLQTNPAGVKREIRDKFKYSEAYMNWEWPHLICSISLSQGLLATLDGQADWLISKGRVKDAENPNFLKKIYFEALEQAKPDAITVIR